MEVPEGREFRKIVVEKEVVKEVEVAAAMAPASPTAAPAAMGPPPDDLAEVERVRQFFPETWLWTDVVTDDNGQATLPAEAPDSITTWMLRAVALSKERGLGVGEAELRVFQPFFVQVDLPYSAIRGEELPVKVALYNYLDTPQDFFVELEESEQFDLIDDPAKTVGVDGNDIGGVEFNIRLRELGNVPLKVTARSRDSADAVVKDILVEPEGVQHEVVDNWIVSAGQHLEFVSGPPELLVGHPERLIPGSARTHVAVTGSYLSQTIEGLEGLLRMPFGCGEQNMILFAPNVFVARYLEETDQLKPEVMAKGRAPDGNRIPARAHLPSCGWQLLRVRRQR